MASTVDGRRWKKYFVSTRKDFDGLRRLAVCGGSLKCLNDNCSYKAEFGHPNRHHFMKNRCKHCQREAFSIHCEGRKIWEFNDNAKQVTVYHHGIHTCSAKLNIPASTCQETISIFKQNPKLKPSEVPIIAVRKALEENKSWEEIDNVTKRFVDQQKIRNLKKKATNELHPFGQSLDAVGILKKKTDERDPFLIFKINDRKFNGEPSFVFKTSKYKLSIMRDMNRNKSSPLSCEYVCIDGFEKRCPGFTTLIVSVYHPVLRKQIKLVVMECEGETSKNVALMWQMIDEALAKIYGIDVRFEPMGIICDEAGAFWKANKAHFPVEVLDNSVSCEFHFKENVNRHANLYSKLFLVLFLSYAPLFRQCIYTSRF